MKMKSSTRIGLGGFILIAFMLSAASGPGENDPAFVAGYYTGRLLILIAGLWLLIKGLIQRRRERPKPVKLPRAAVRRDARDESPKNR